MADRRQSGDAGGSIDPEARTVEGADSGGAAGGIDALFERGAVLDRFTVLGKLGEGGMGVVVAAYDPNLDRKVAIKVLRTGSRGSESASRGRQRLVREAQAMARLSHPNVIVVHEVGSVGDQVFVAMEHVQGSTLTRWLGGNTRSWRETLDAFLQAGRGLAAAHDAHMVHRDFKPDNVLVGEDGRVRVTDFGLVSSGAAEARDRDDDPETPDAALLTTAPLFTTLTHSGALLGTPVYMAPEQHDRRPVDARADQFAFCVALFEALFGYRPFEGASYPELASNVRDGKIAAPPDDCGVPARIRGAVMRGLSLDPAERFPSMHDLLSELEPDPGPTQSDRRKSAVRIGAIAVAVLAGGVGGVLAWRGAGSDMEACSGAASHLVGVWDDPVKAEVATAFEQTGRPYAVATYERVAEALDRFATRWVEARTDACEATRVRGEQSEALLDLRMQCLDRRLAELAGVTELLRKSTDVRMLDSAVDLARSLGPLDACADAEALRAVVPVPDDPETRLNVKQLRDRLGRVVALANAGRYKQVLESAAKLEREAREIGYKPLHGEVLYRLGGAHMALGDADEAEDAFRRAMLAATEGKDDELLANALIERVFVVGYMQRKFDQGLALREHAESAIARAGNDGVLRAQLYNNAAGIHYARNEIDEAIALYRRAVELLSEELGEAHPKVAVILGNIGAMLQIQGKLDEAVEATTRSIEIREQTLGKNHPQTGVALANLGGHYANQGKHREALEAYAQALVIKKATYGEAHTEVARVLYDMGTSHHALGEYDRACERHAEAIAVAEAAGESDGENSIYPLMAMGECKLAGGRPAQAIELLERAVALEAPPALLADARFLLARALWGSNRDRARARKLARQARDDLAAGDDPEGASRVDAWLRRPR